MIVFPNLICSDNELVPAQHCMFPCDKTSSKDGAPCPVIQPNHYPNHYPNLPWQYDGNLSLSSDSSSNLTQPSLNHSPNFTPQLHSTPTQDIAPDTNLQNADDTQTVIPLLFDSLEQSSSSCSLQSWSDLDNLLPFSISDDQQSDVTPDQPSQANT